ncbi:MAG: YkgJ family cysteine cluster protein [Proteobacteria bacterium]|nr:YkgJ family cysteine cluster protein [Pseudomonadota bacterium]MBU1710114.1 YkgJ family cysteine cluster protein [Pseudomonadota bacterium]
MIGTSNNPCLECGACCASYRVSFYWSEAGEDVSCVPIELTGQLSHHRAFMLGTNGQNPRCKALMGIIGKKVHCAIHSRRSSVCRNFISSWQDGRPQPDCDKVRARFNLDPLQPHHWQPDNPTPLPIAA